MTVLVPAVAQAQVRLRYALLFALDRAMISSHCQGLSCDLVETMKL